MTRALAIVPARAGSKRIPGKNVREFLGKPLIHWSIEVARALPRFDVVMVSTDSEDIARVSRQAGADVPWLRPAELASDAASTVDVVHNVLDRYAREGQRFDYVAVLQPTTPIRLAERWQEAFRHLDNGAPAAIGVTAAAVHPYWSYKLEEGGVLSPFFPEGIKMRSQLLPPACTVNGSLYLTRCDELKAQGMLAPPGVRGVLCSQDIEAIDIDTQDDWAEAEKLVRAHLQRSK